MGTLSKTLAACGGYIAGKQELIDVLKYQAPGLVYSVGLSPPLAAAASAALAVLKAEPERVARVAGQRQAVPVAGQGCRSGHGHQRRPRDRLGHRRRSDQCRARLPSACSTRGLNVLPIIYPAVPLKAARFRFFITSEHTPDQIRSAVKIMCEVMEELGAKRRAA